MTIELLKKVALYTRAKLKTPTKIDGYSDEEVKNAVSELMNKDVIFCGTSKKYSPSDGNYIIKEGSAVQTDKVEIVTSATVSEHQFERCYGEKLF